MTVREAAMRLGCSRDHVHIMIRSGALSATKGAAARGPTGAYDIDEESVEAQLRAQEMAGVMDCLDCERDRCDGCPALKEV